MNFFKRIISNPQTTVTGFTSLLAGIITLVKASTISPELITTAGGLISTGIGLLLATDSKG